MSQSDAILDRLMSLHPKVIDLSLDRMRRLLADLGDPQDRIPPVVHVAGTNGKGSTQAYIRAGLEAAGLRVHAYTSPHLAFFNERIRLAGQLIGDEMLAETLAEVEMVNAGQPITFFEVTTAAAFLAFIKTAIIYQDDKIAAARRLVSEQGLELRIQIDGGVTARTIERAAEAGANVFVAGSAVYKSDDALSAITDLRERAASNLHLA